MKEIILIIIFMFLFFIFSHSNKPILYVELSKDLGLGNQLFIIFNGLSLSHKYNRKPVFIYHSDQTYRTQGPRISLFKKLEFKNKSILKIDQKHIYSDYGSEYRQIQNLNTIRQISGYFQSHRYFIDHADIIKRHLYIDLCLQNKITNTMKNISKTFISIHVRLGDYKNNSFHYSAPLEYYRIALSKFNTSRYQIVIVSDSVNEAIEFLKPLNLNIITTKELHDQPSELVDFYILMLSDVIIGCASSFSLSAAYISYMYNFKQSNFIFPKTWFGENGPKYDINDIVLTSDQRFTIL